MKSTSDERLIRLLHEAFEAVRLENENLRSAFEQATDGAFYDGINRSLAYTVFETNLAYSVFKRWIPMARVRWEAQYPGSARRADLVVYNDLDPGKEDWVVELKWWPNEHSKTLGILAADLEKMRAWKGVKGRVLLGFWFSPDSDHSKDTRAVEKFSDAHGLQRIFLKHFPVDVRGKGQPWHMAMTALLA